MTIGILAYGSLLNDPGIELASTVQRVGDTETPFAVEFARKSRTRDGGPTLIRVESAGDSVAANVLVLKDTVDEESACGILYRRETRQVGRGVPCPTRRPSWIRRLEDFGSVEVCLYAAFESNLSRDEGSPRGLAQLAIKSASCPAGMDRRDGISYLETVKLRGVTTPLMARYESEILSQTNAQNLVDAWARARAGS